MSDFGQMAEDVRRQQMHEEQREELEALNTSLSSGAMVAWTAADLEPLPEGELGESSGG